MKQGAGTEALNRMRKLRRALTEPEPIIWNAVRDCRLGGMKFRRQVWIGCYIADFFVRRPS